MSVRLWLTDEAWVAMVPLLATLQARAGSPPALRDRRLIEAVLSRARTGTPWRDLPDDFGRWAAVSNRLRRWAARGIGRRRWERRQAADGRVALHRLSDATMVRAHPQAAGA
jgi:transposase